jgi:large subunit ribosomal protein L3
MITTLFGFKQDQTRVFAEDGTQVFVTNISITPCIVTRVIHTDGNQRYQLGIGHAKKLKKPEQGQLKKAGIEKNPRFFREVEANEGEEPLKVGTEVKPGDVFAIGDTIIVTGVSKGKGFASAIRRYHFAGGPKTHGQGDHWRAPGSIGSGTTPGRVYKGKKMAGRLGGDTVTVKGLKIIAIDNEKHVVSVSGAVPGAKNGLVRLTKQG